jgi:5-methylcytosine-specific restriction enzyme subunit McrC
MRGILRPNKKSMANAYTLFEHETLYFDWENRHLRILEHAKTAKGSDILTATTHQGHRVLRAHQFVGTLRLGSDTITILPKIDYGEDRVRSATRNLLYMLEQAGYLPAHYQDLVPMLPRGRDWFELLTRIFALELLTQWQRGPHHQYQSIEDNLVALKGKWQVNRQLRQPARDHRFEVIFDEFTADNQLSRVFRYVVEQLWLRTRDSSNRRLLGELRQWLDPVSLAPYMTATAVPPGIISRLNNRFEPLLNLSRLFLENGSLELSRGDLQTFAFVFNMNQLFEEFLDGFIRRYRAEALPESLQDCTLHSQAKYHTRHLARTNDGQPVFKLKPDLMFRRGSEFPLLVDAKYKLLTPEDRRLGVSQSDFYQMFAYAHRYHSPAVILLYPQDRTPLRARFKLAGHNAAISAATVDLHRDFSRSENRRALAKEIKAIISTEITHG